MAPTTFDSIHPCPEVDLRALKFVDHISSELVCTICLSPFVGPETLVCGHTFCAHCLSETLGHQCSKDPHCPLCRQEARLDAPVPKLIERVLDSLRVKCPNHELGCKDVLPRGEVKMHVMHHCDYSAIECPKEGCHYSVLRKQAEEECVHVRVTCELCRQTGWRSQLHEHLEQTCPADSACCLLCHEAMPCWLLESHLAVCSTGAPSFDIDERQLLSPIVERRPGVGRRVSGFWISRSRTWSESSSGDLSSYGDVFE